MKQQARLPLVAVTMGDPAGVGPEIIAGALAHGGATLGVRPVVVGNLARLNAAAEIVGLGTRFTAVSDARDAVGDGEVAVLDAVEMPSQLPWGRPAAAGGEAAFQAVRHAVALARDGIAQAICTAPLNKSMLRLSGHDFPGHTELLASLFEVQEVSMMLTAPKLRVIHVTTHLGLVDAIARIEPDLVFRTIRRGHDALVRAGIPTPRIGVCAINPHAGENGLFGYGEEAEKIEPGVRAAREAGIDADGPLPADTLFFRAVRGDFDLVVAMYHDQGHGPVKALGIDVGVNVTVGLPIIRTSVDHGTAFDIAGTGTADAEPMREALRQAARLSAAV